MAANLSHNLSFQEELCFTSTGFFSSPSTRFAQVTTCVSSLSRGAGGEEWVECAMGHFVESCIVQTWTTFCLVFNPCACLWSDFLAPVVKHTVLPRECCLQPLLSSRALALRTKVQCGYFSC